RLLRARVGRGNRGSRTRLGEGRRACCLCRHRSRAQGPRSGRMKIHVRAPATTANLGPGFDVAGAALDLWNELEVGDANGSVDSSHLGVRAFARYAPPSEWSFSFTDRIPRERGLGSSAAVVALGLVAGAIAAGVDPSADELLAKGLDLEGHAD